jgi:hypothetical protein
MGTVTAVVFGGNDAYNRRLRESFLPLLEN